MFLYYSHRLLKTKLPSLAVVQSIHGHKDKILQRFCPYRHKWYSFTWLRQLFIVRMLRVTGQFILFNKFQGQMKCKICNKLFFQSQI